jgi:hypothetical protein
MTNFIRLLIVSSLMAVSSLAAAANIRPVESLHDLPAKWEGVAGGLLTRMPATLTIEKVLKVTHNEGGSGFSATYDVAASMTFGARSLNITQIVMNRYGTVGTNYEFYMHTDDELVQTVWVSVAYDETSDSYLMRDMVQNGERRFSLSAPAPKRN